MISLSIATTSDMTWREKLAKAMDDRGVTQYRLAKETGLRQSRISLWLSGTGDPSLEEWGMISDVLDIPVAWFIDRSEAPAPDYRSPEEQMLIRVARKVGIEAIWEVIAEAAVSRAAKILPTSGPLGFVREVDLDAGKEKRPADPKKDKPGEEGKPKKKS